MKRVIVGLKWAMRLEEKPVAIPNGRSRGRKALGIKYEKELGLAHESLREAHGVWFEFEDKNGHGYCQVDFLIENLLARTAFVLEAKHTWTEDGHVELEKLYLPVVKLALDCDRVEGIVVCKKLLPYMKGVFIAPTLRDAIIHSSAAKRTVWHWVPTGIYRPRKAGKGLGRKKRLATGPFAAYA